MLKVFLVEDEVVVREGIKRKINWEEFGFTFAGEASDGEIAYSLIREHKPDVLITDIKMPFMDGLELSRLVHAEMPWVKIVILTGHDDFNYAQQAIGIGVADYLLKPVSRTQIIETICKVKAQIEAEQEQQRFLQLFHEEMREKEKLEQQHFFDELVSGAKPVPQLLNSAKELGLDLGGQSYCVVLLRATPEKVREEEYSEELVTLDSQLEDLFIADSGTLLFKRGIEGYALLVRGGQAGTAGALARDAALKVEVLFAGQDIPYFIGAGKQVERLQEIADSYKTASRVFAYQYLTEESRTLWYEELQTPAVQAEELSVKNLDVQAMDNHTVVRFLKSGSRENAAYFVRDLFEAIGEEHIASLMLRQYVAMGTYFAALSFLGELGVDKDAFITRCGDINKVSGELSSVDSTRAYLITVLEQALAARDEKSQKRHSALLRTAEEFIQQHFHEENISLNQVAKVVNVSPTHFSAIFSQEMGRTFIEYLTAQRMEKAKELLRCTGMKTSEIAYAVGYRDPHYFSFLFKKMQGLTPREFKTKGAEAE